MRYIGDKEPITNVFLSHDIDYSKAGPSNEHILNRRERFDKIEFAKYQAGQTTLYYNIPDIMNIEEKIGVRSTFFFRPCYETGDLESYGDDVQQLIKGGWEVGLHINNAKNIESEKEKLETLTKRPVDGCRVHFLRNQDGMYTQMKRLGIKYDSSVCFSKDRLDPLNVRVQYRDEILVFPITIMDAYVFTYMRISEEKLIPLIQDAVKLTKERGNLLTLLWHDSSIKMIGGRKYKEILEFLSAQESVNIVTGVGAYKIFSKKEEN